MKISDKFTVAAAFGNVHGVYRPGNVKLTPIILDNSQKFVQSKFKTIEKPIRCYGIIMFQGTKAGLIFHLFSCAMLEAALKRTKTLPKHSWDAPRTLQDAPGRLLDSVWEGLGGYWVHLGPPDGPKTAPRRDQDPPKSRPKHLPRRTWQPEPPRHPK